MSNTVVIADDDADIRELVTIAATKSGLTVLATVSDGKSALDAIRTHNPDLAILDISMPKLTGLQAARRILEYKPELRVLMLSMHDNEEFLFEALRVGAAGADYFMAKPFSPRELTAWLSVGKEPR